MVEVLVWVLVLSSWDGGMLKVENIRSWDDCERLRMRAEAVITPARRQTMSGVCTQIGILVPKPVAAPPITVNVPQQPAPVVNNRVIIRKAP